VKSPVVSTYVEYVAGKTITNNIEVTTMICDITALGPYYVTARASPVENNIASVLQEAQATRSRKRGRGRETEREREPKRRNALAVATAVRSLPGVVKA